eukprot:SAG22_NODE_253_length_13622_cov_15.026471_4_plen_607_part_00
MQEQERWIRIIKRRARLLRDQVLLAECTPEPAKVIHVALHQVPYFQNMENDSVVVDVLQPDTAVQAEQILMDNQGKLKLKHSKGWSPMASPAGTELFKCETIEPLAPPGSEPEPESVFASSAQDCLQQIHVLAKTAVAEYDHWLLSLDHSSAYADTDKSIELLSACVDSIEADSDWAGNRGRDIKTIQSHKTAIEERVRSERALREIEPHHGLRAAMWGVGPCYPQLSEAQLARTTRRFLAVRCKKNLAQVYDAADATKDIHWHAARDLVHLQQAAAHNADGERWNRLRTSANQIALNCAGIPLYHAADTMRTLLKDELDSLDSTIAKARATNIYAEIEGCRPHVDADPPDTSELDRLIDIVDEQTEDFQKAQYDKEFIDRRCERLRWDATHPKYPTPAEISKALEDIKASRRELRATSKRVDAEKHKMAEASKHWPEILVSVPDVADFKRMDFLRTDTTYDSYEDIQPLGDSRNDVSTATLDGEPVVLKAYDLTKQTTVAKVQEEVRYLHQMRHPNIVQVDAVFQRIERGITKMYVQMPRYACDMKAWLQQNLRLQPEKRRKLLLGLMRAVARVHEFRFTHNDIKLENVLLTQDRKEAVLCDLNS